ncbi:hypothetical protein CDAR_550371 [Caerostris darwini]|uniref:Uncharacterized protein n=1 Tax=Caerostris darwini TaxID=1538125 RepID=A0AAV4X8V9_9ARAC|nr:hypothetical protein CDAR_550371 [Caerostris darwini]
MIDVHDLAHAQSTFFLPSPPVRPLPVSEAEESGGKSLSSSRPWVSKKPASRSRKFSIRAAFSSNYPRSELAAYNSHWVPFFGLDECR